MSFLDKDGVSLFWKTCKSWFGSKVSGSKSGNNITLNLYGKSDNDSDGSDEDKLINSTTLSMQKSSVESPVFGESISADDITQWSPGSLSSLTLTKKTVTPVESFNSGSVPSLTVEDTSVVSECSITPSKVSAGQATLEDGVLSFSFNNVVSDISSNVSKVTVGSSSSWDPGSCSTLTFGDSIEFNSADNWSQGALPTLNYTEKSIPNVSSLSNKDVLTDIDVAN